MPAGRRSAGSPAVPECRQPAQARRRLEAGSPRWRRARRPLPHAAEHSRCCSRRASEDETPVTYARLARPGGQRGRRARRPVASVGPGPSAELQELDEGGAWPPGLDRVGAPPSSADMIVIDGESTALHLPAMRPRRARRGRVGATTLRRDASRADVRERSHRVWATSTSTPAARARGHRYLGEARRISHPTATSCPRAQVEG